MPRDQLNGRELRQALESYVGGEIPADSMEKLEKIVGRSGISRREFITALGAGVGAFILSNSILKGSVVSAQEKEIVHYPQTRYPTQIQSPEHYGLEGCMIGYFSGLVFVSMDQRGGRVKMNDIVDRYEKKVGKTPSIVFSDYKTSRLSEYGRFPTEYCVGIAEKGVIPFVDYDFRNTQDKVDYILSDIIKGKADHLIKNFAQQAREFGEQYGGFLIRMMREMNDRGYLWGGNAGKFKKTWKHVWQIFEDEGANEYATWVWAPQANIDRLSRGKGAEQYYPDDEKYVDWIGMTGYSSSRVDYASLKEVFEATYLKMRRNHPSKPIMINEIGCHESSGKPEWMKNAFHSVKHSFPGIKALCWWDMDWSNTWMGLDTRIDSSSEALQAFKE